MKRYSAKLLFQFRPVGSKKGRGRRVCEERIVTFDARSPKSALAKAKGLGTGAEYQEEHGASSLSFEFIGVMQLLDISLNYAEGEVWSELIERVRPSERRSDFIPHEDELDAFRTDIPVARGRLKAW